MFVVQAAAIIQVCDIKFKNTQIREYSPHLDGTHEKMGRLHGSGRISRIDSTTLDTITRHSRAEMAQYRSLEAKLLSGQHSTVLRKGTASYSHARNSRMFDMADLLDVMNVANKALEIAVATRVFKDRYNFIQTRSV